MNTSATGGFLAPSPTPAVVEGQDFEDFLQQFFTGLTGLPGELVFPRWQLEPPNYPAVGKDWAAFGVIYWRPDTYGCERFHAAGDGSDLQRHETVETLASFYGPNAARNCGVFRDGLQVAQNRELLTLNGVGLLATGDAQRVPELVKNQWLNRVDLPWDVRRRIQRTYPVLNLLSFQGTVYRDGIPQLIDDVGVSQ